MTLHIGTSGWSYNHWEGVLYPPRTPLKERLIHYVVVFQPSRSMPRFTDGQKPLPSIRGNGRRRPTLP